MTDVFSFHLFRFFFFSLFSFFFFEMNSRLIYLFVVVILLAQIALRAFANPEANHVGKQVRVQSGVTKNKEGKEIPVYFEQAQIQEAPSRQMSDEKRAEIEASIKDYIINRVPKVHKKRSVKEKRSGKIKTKRPSRKAFSIHLDN